MCNILIFEVGLIAVQTDFQNSENFIRPNKRTLQFYHGKRLGSNFTLMVMIKQSFLFESQSFTKKTFLDLSKWIKTENLSFLLLQADTCLSQILGLCRKFVLTYIDLTIK